MQAGASSLVTHAKPAQILLVEDDAGDAYLVSEFLAHKSTEFTVTWVRSLAEALGAMTPAIDCVILDLGLPDTQGLGGLEAILEQDRRAAIVVLTGFDDRSSGERALVLGAQDYLSKGSVTEELLSRALRYAIARRRGEEAARQLRDAELFRAENARLERGLLPSPLVLNPAVSWATRYQPGGRRALLGGDFFDAVELGDGTIRAVIGDVCGHGPDEAALGVALRVAWRALVLAHQSPHTTLSALERVLEVERNDAPMAVTFVTLCDIELEPSLRRANIRLAGHPCPLLYDGAKVEEVRAAHRSPPLGATKGASSWVPNLIELGNEWTILAFTDGLVEARVGSGGERLDTDGLLRLSEKAFATADTLSQVADALVAGAEASNGAPLADDMALVLLSVSSRWRS